MIRRLALVLLVVAALVVPVAASARTHATTVTVTAAKPGEFHFKLSKLTVPKGVVTFKVTNRGSLPHDFQIASKKTPLLQPGKSSTLKVSFRKAGRYAYRCTVPGHAAAGMQGKLRVR